MQDLSFWYTKYATLPSGTHLMFQERGGHFVKTDTGHLHCLENDTVTAYAGLPFTVIKP